MEIPTSNPEHEYLSTCECGARMRVDLDSFLAFLVGLLWTARHSFPPHSKHPVIVVPVIPSQRCLGRRRWAFERQ